MRTQYAQFSVQNYEILLIAQTKSVKFRTLWHEIHHRLRKNMALRPFTHGYKVQKRRAHVLVLSLLTWLAANPLPVLSPSDTPLRPIW
jgi:hypothetical protein